MPEIRESEFMQDLREGPTAALEHFRALYQSRAPGLITGQDKLFSCARDLLVYFMAPSKSPHDPDIIAQAMDLELRRACFESEMLSLFADMIADRDFLRHYSVSAASHMFASTFSCSADNILALLIGLYAVHLEVYFDPLTCLASRDAESGLSRFDVARVGYSVLSWARAGMLELLG